MWRRKRDAKSSPVVMVMVVDDEAAIRLLERRLLNDAGFSVMEAEDSAAALNLVTGAVQPDLVIADLNMPGMNGEELARRLRVMLPGVKVLFVTGHVDALFDLRPTFGASEAYLEKPFTRTGLIEAVSLLMYDCLPSATAAARSPVVFSS